MRVENIQESDGNMTMEFDLIGVDAAFANTLRRIMISGMLEKIMILFKCYSAVWARCYTSSTMEMGVLRGQEICVP